MRVPPLAALAAALAAVACARASAPVHAPVEVSVAAVAPPPSPGIVAGRSRDDICTVWLAVERIQKSSPGCYMDQHVTDGPGMLTYACGGDGEAEALFGDHRYRGHVRGGDVQLELDTELDWEDGCRWGTHHVIRGVLTVNGQPTFGKLSWRYADRVLHGDRCSGVCTAFTEIEVARTKDEARLKSEPIDDEEPDFD